MTGANRCGSPSDRNPLPHPPGPHGTTRGVRRAIDTHPMWVLDRHDMTTRPDETVPVSLTHEEWADIIGMIYGGHGEFCISSDNCDCYDLAGRIHAQLPTAEDAVPPSSSAGGAAERGTGA